MVAITREQPRPTLKLPRDFGVSVAVVGTLAGLVLLLCLAAVSVQGSGPRGGSHVTQNGYTDIQSSSPGDGMGSSVQLTSQR